MNYPNHLRREGREGGNQEAHLQLNTRLMGIPLRRWLECRSGKNAGETTRQERHQVQRETTTIRNHADWMTLSCLDDVIMMSIRCAQNGD